MTTKAFGYLRVSGKGQLKGDGLTRQHLAIMGYAKAHDINVVKMYREEGITGTMEASARPAWAETLVALHSNGVKIIIVERLDRLARDLMAQEVAIADLQKHGFTLVSVLEPDLMATDPTRILMRQLMGAVSQYDKSMIVAKLRGARQRKKAATGSCEGKKSYGFYPGEQATLTRMQELRAGGMAFDRIAAQLNAEGLPNRAGGQWFGGICNRILTGHRSDKKPLVMTA